MSAFEIAACFAAPFLALICYYATVPVRQYEEKMREYDEEKQELDSLEFLRNA